MTTFFLHHHSLFMQKITSKALQHAAISLIIYMSIPPLTLTPTPALPISLLTFPAQLHTCSVFFTSFLGLALLLETPHCFALSQNSA
jgi:hypothetical protein